MSATLIAESAALAEIPIIDFSAFRTGNAGMRGAAAKEIDRACRDVGFFYIVNHGVAPGLIASTFAESRRFFAQPMAVKNRVAIARSACHRGYFSLGGENLDPATQRLAGDYKEGLKIGRDLALDHPLVVAGTPLHGPNQWPDGLPGWRETMQEYYAALSALGREIMHAFALGLDLEERYFDRWLTGPMATVGPLHYPPLEGPLAPSHLSAGAHTDFGCLTVLAQDDVPGLQVRAHGREWREALVVPDSFVVNIGDMMARWTNDLYASTLHRVINLSGRERYSIAFFFDPDFDADLSCIPTCQGPNRPAKYPPTTGGQHLLDMIDQTFAYRHDDAND